MAENQINIVNHPQSQKLDLLLQKRKKITLVSQIYAKPSVEQFPNDFYAEENISFCKFCLHSVDILGLTQRSSKIKNLFEKKKPLKKSHLN